MSHPNKPKKPAPDEDTTYRDVCEYVSLYEHCTALEILELMGEMRDFFFSRMTEADWKTYREIADAPAKTPPKMS